MTSAQSSFCISSKTHGNLRIFQSAAYNPNPNQETTFDCKKKYNFTQNHKGSKSRWPRLLWFNSIFQYSTSTPAEGPRICETLASTTHGTRNSVILSPKTVGKCQCRGTMTLGCSTRELNSMPETTLQCRGTQF